jgi:hypothetical protein
VPLVSKNKNFNFIIEQFNLVQAKLKISYMAAKQQISILELFINSILKVYALRYLNLTNQSLIEMEEKENKAFQDMSINPLLVLH